MSAARRGRKLSQQHRAAISARTRGEPKSPAHRAAISSALTGRTLSDAMRDRLRVIMLRRALRGDDHPCAVLTERQVADIKRALLEDSGYGSITAIAVWYDVSRQTISAIKSGRNWRHVEPRPPRFLTVTFRDIRSARRRAVSEPEHGL
jgi:predicted ATPase